MPLVSNECGGQFFEPVAVGPVAQNYPPVSPPAQIAANSSYTVGPLPSDGFKTLAVAAETTGPAMLSVQRYIDLLGAIPQGPASTLSLAANTVGVANIVGAPPFGSFAVTVTNGGAEAIGLSTFAVMQTAQ